MFAGHSTEGYEDVLAGIRRRTLVAGERTLMTEFILKAGAALPAHAHPYEQTGYLVAGRLVLIVDGRRYDARPGDGWCVPAAAVHSAEIVEDSVAVEVFSPVREDYLPAAGHV